MFYKGIAGIESVHSMTYEFNQEKIVENLYRFMGKKKNSTFPMPLQSMNTWRGGIPG